MSRASDALHGVVGAVRAAADDVVADHVRPLTAPADRDTVADRARPWPFTMADPRCVVRVACAPAVALAVWRDAVGATRIRVRQHRDGWGMDLLADAWLDAVPSLPIDGDPSSTTLVWDAQGPVSVRVYSAAAPAVPAVQSVPPLPSVPESTAVVELVVDRDGTSLSGREIARLLERYVQLLEARGIDAVLGAWHASATRSRSSGGLSELVIG